MLNLILGGIAVSVIACMMAYHEITNMTKEQFIQKAVEIWEDCNKDKEAEDV
jgi:hypothetical protein